MTAQRLHQGLVCYRIGDPAGAFPIFDAEGSRIAPGRWNTGEGPVVYAAEHYSTAMLEKLVHGQGRLPPNQHFIEIILDKGLSYETFSEPAHPGWDGASREVARAFGAQWRRERRSLLLFAPSVAARMERNVIINPDHPEYAALRHSLHQPVWWDARLFGARA